MHRYKLYKRTTQDFARGQGTLSNTEIENGKTSTCVNLRYLRIFRERKIRYTIKNRYIACFYDAFENVEIFEGGKERKKAKGKVGIGGSRARAGRWGRSRGRAT